MDALEIEGDKHNVVYILGARLQVKCGRTQGPPYTARDEAGFEWLRVSGGVIERCEGEGFKGCVTGHANV